MTLPRFRAENLDPSLAAGELADAFQRFAADVLRSEYPGLHLYPTGGKDGAIDANAIAEGQCTVFEFKHIGEDEIDSAWGQWKVVAERLWKHLADPSGPTKGQGQYFPWYDKGVPIRSYIFCVSSILSNLAQATKLRDEIASFFDKLAAERSHLSHLDKLKVQILDWQEFDRRVQDQPHLRFRWFPRERPLGLVPLDAAAKPSGFRDYLTRERLPYYSLSHHLQLLPPPAGVKIVGEEELRDYLESGTSTGLVITGSGGVGKTRLILELGWQVLERGWTVLRVHERLRPGALDVLTSKIAPGARVLLLVDYIETQRDFVELANELTERNNTYNLRLHFIANCRSSYYHILEGAVDHVRVDLSPAVGAEAEWYEGHRRATVRHILEQGGIEPDERHIEVCRDVPVLAVFMAFLKAAQRGPWLEELLAEKDFGQWVSRRIRRTLGGGDIDRDLAHLIALFPMTHPVFRDLYSNHGPLLQRLAADGWVEQVDTELSDENRHWLTVHDVLADRIVLSYLESIPHTIELFVDELFDRACQHRALRSALTTLQRLVDQPSVASLPWLKILGQRLATDSESWRDTRDILIRTTLLDEPGRLELLNIAPEFWQGAEQEVEFQNAIGWLARWSTKSDSKNLLSESQKNALRTWASKAASHAQSSNYILTSGIRICPEDIREASLAWLRSYSRAFQAHYLLNAWLKAGLPPEDVSSFITDWILHYPGHSHQSFLLRAWLDAGGGIEAVREHALAWVGRHGESPEARFVYAAWLKAGGEVADVREHALAWIGRHGESPEARFVYAAWLKAGGGIEAVREHALAWIGRHGESPEASFVYAAWLDAGGEVADVREHALAWVGRHGESPEAQFVYAAWLDAGGGIEAVREHALAWVGRHGESPEAQFVYAAWLKAGGEVADVREHALAWVGRHGESPEAQFVYAAWLKAGGGIEAVREHALAWIGRHGESPEARFVYAAWLKAGGDFSRIQLEAARWLRQNRTRWEAVFLTKELSKLPSLSIDSINDILEWCRTFAHDEDALWRASRLASHITQRHILSHANTLENLVDVVELLIRHRLTSEHLKRPHTSLMLTSLCSLLARLELYLSLVQNQRVERLLLDFVRHPVSFTAIDKHTTNAERPAIIYKIRKLLRKAMLSIDSDRDALHRFLSWVNRQGQRALIGRFGGV